MKTTHLKSEHIPHSEVDLSEIDEEKINPSEPFTAVQREERDQIIDRIKRAQDESADCGQALLRIRAHRLFRETHATFELWCSEVLDLSQQRVSHLIKQSEDLQRLKQLGVDAAMIPATERGFRALRKLRSKDNTIPVLELAVRLGNGARPTGASIEEARFQIEGDDLRKPKTITISVEAAIKAADTLKGFLTQSSFDEFTIKELRDLKAKISEISDDSEKLKNGQM